MLTTPLSSSLSYNGPGKMKWHEVWAPSVALTGRTLLHIFQLCSVRLDIRLPSSIDVLLFWKFPSSPTTTLLQVHTKNENYILTDVGFSSILGHTSSCTRLTKTTALKVFFIGATPASNQDEWDSFKDQALTHPEDFETYSRTTVEGARHVYSRVDQFG